MTSFASSNTPPAKSTEASYSRRDLLQFSVSGLLSVALAQLLTRDSLRADENRAATSSPATAKRVIHISLIGGYSQVDSFDYKPELERWHGKSLPSDAQPDTFFGSAGLLCKSHWNFKQRGESGLWISELFPHLAEVADHLTIINSMVSDTANHTPATFQQFSGFQANGFPAIGSWLSYGLGNENDSLPTFVVLPDVRSLPSGGAANWASGFLPPQHQGTIFRSGPSPVKDLQAREIIQADAESDARNLLLKLNRIHQRTRVENELLDARIRAYELAARMQASIPEATDLAGETESTLQMYGAHEKDTQDAAQRCLLARRLIERGVRYVQIFSGGCFGGSPRHGWDSHENCLEDHAREARMIDRPIAALLRDLHQRGLLRDTLVLFTTEFGRTPFANAPQGSMGLGRDHNPEGFTVWMAGGGTKAGINYGATDPWGWKAIENRVTWPDLHATILHLLGINHEKLTFYHNGIERRLTNVHGEVIRAILG